jgi:hypothetical protein
MSEAKVLPMSAAKKLTLSFAGVLAMSEAKSLR